jgi:anthranilate synthase/aminodeoxychorismate synthase-like glutamine amidotransferase
MILLIDNFDSFTFNLVQVLGSIGAELKVVRNNAISLEQIDALEPDQILISPGPCTPDEAGVSMEVIRAFAGRCPILGVCLGHQSIGQVFGGKVVRAPTPVHGKTAAITHDGEGVFRGLPQPFTAARYHSLVVEQASLPDCLEVTAHYDGLIMGLRHREYPMLEGVQFHPESFFSPDGKQLLGNFLEYRLPRSGRERAAA